MKNMFFTSFVMQQQRRCYKLSHMMKIDCESHFLHFYSNIIHNTKQSKTKNSYLLKPMSFYENNPKDHPTKALIHLIKRMSQSLNHNNLLVEGNNVTFSVKLCHSLFSPLFLPPNTLFKPNDSRGR